jgi:hypothetical protein
MAGIQERGQKRVFAKNNAVFMHADLNKNINLKIILSKN